MLPSHSKEKRENGFILNLLPRKVVPVHFVPLRTAATIFYFWVVRASKPHTHEPILFPVVILEVVPSILLFLEPQYLVALPTKVELPVLVSCIMFLKLMLSRESCWTLLANVLLSQMEFFEVPGHSLTLKEDFLMFDTIIVLGFV